MYRNNNRVRVFMRERERERDVTCVGGCFVHNIILYCTTIIYTTTVTGFDGQ